MPFYALLAGMALLVLGLVGIAVHLGIEPFASGGGVGLWLLIATAGGFLLALGLISVLRAILRELRSLRSYLTGPPVDLEEISTSAGPVLHLTIRASKRWWLQIDQPSAAPGIQKRHAHVYVKDIPILVVNEDGTGSHGTDAGAKIADDNKVRVGLAAPAIFRETLEHVLMRRFIETYPNYERILMIVGEEELAPLNLRELGRG